ncbi:MAG: DUF5777 family beta-barrel protein [Vicinamibacterales bacterium]
MTHLFATAALLFLTAGEGGGTDRAVNATQDQAERSDRAVDPAQPDFTIIGMPTTLPIPRFASAFRVTHRFTRPLGSGNFGDLVEDAFGFDSGAQIGLEYRFGIMAGTQVGIHRTSDRTIQFFAQHHLIDQGTSPVGIDVIATAEGTNNFRDSYSPAVGAVVSRTLGRHGAIYAHPIYINNTSPDPSELTDDNDSFIVGVGARVRVRPTVYLVAEAVPRFGYEPDKVYTSFGIEKRAGGHSFQINFGNGFGTTLAQMARGGLGDQTWFIGFNISRKFF